MKIRVGVGLGNRSGSVTRSLFHRVVDECERLRFDSLWFSERLGGPALDPTVAMTAAAARTERLKFGPAVMVLPGRNPVVLAKTMASLDVVSDGRLLPAFGLGAPQLAEHQAFGVERSDRAPIFDEALGLMRRLWTESSVSHHGRFFDVDDVKVEPKPVQSPLEVWLGGVAPSELNRVGRLADGWLPSFVTPEGVRVGIERINEVASTHDREIDAEHFGALIPMVPPDLDPAIAEFITARNPGAELTDLAATGLDQLIDLIGRFAEVGASKFVVVPSGDLEDVARQLEPLSSAVRPLET